MRLARTPITPAAAAAGVGQDRVNFFVRIVNRHFYLMKFLCSFGLWGHLFVAVCNVVISNFTNSKADSILFIQSLSFR